MSRAQEPHRPFLSFGNPFRMKSPKGSHLSPKLLDLLNAFEESLAGRLRKLKPSDREDVVRLTWMRSCLESLCGIHTDIKALITALELPINDWDDKWIDVYLDNSVKLLDICIAFSSEISRMKQGRLFLQCVSHNLGSASSKQFVKARSSLDGWRQHIASKNPRLENCFSVMDSLEQTLDLPRIKNSGKGKVLMQAMYGVKVITLYVCSIFAAALCGSSKKLKNLQVPETCLWVEAFTNLQTFVNNEIRNKCSSGTVNVVKELEAVDACVKKLYPIVQDGVNAVEDEALRSSSSNLEKSTKQFSEGLDVLAKEVDSFFQIVLGGRDALLSNLRVGGNVSEKPRTNNSVEGQIVR